jgi:glutathione-regulated potassium-efflux system ancillary protein KefG
MPHSNRILILFAHPAVQKSQVNRKMAVKAKELPGVTLHDLYEDYPDLNIDVAREQQLLLSHDVIVLQHPFYWYSTPAILKEWCDLVLEHGFAYGDNGNKLEGKAWVHALTTGGPESAYQSGGYNRFSIRQLLTPLDQTAYLCGMHFLAPFVVHGALALQTDAEIEQVAQEYQRFLLFLSDYEAGWKNLTQGERFQQFPKSVQKDFPEGSKGSPKGYL